MGSRYVIKLNFLFKLVDCYLSCHNRTLIPYNFFSAGTNSSESRKTKKKKSHLSLVGTASGLGSNKKKKPKPPAPPTPSIYDDIN